MTWEERMEWMAQQQAQFWADMEVLKEADRRARERLDRHDAELAAQKARFDEIGEFLLHLAQANEEQRLRLDEEARRREEESRRVDERLNAVILLAERYFSKRDNN